MPSSGERGGDPVVAGVGVAGPRGVEQDEVVAQGQVAVGRGCADEGGDGRAHGRVALVGGRVADGRGARSSAAGRR